MKWKGRRESSNVEDRRGKNGKMVMGGGIGGIIIILLFTLLGGNPGELINSISTNNEADSNAPYQESAQEKELADFVSVVLADTEDVWSAEFNKRGLEYEEPKLVLYSGSVQSTCGSAS